MILILGFLGMHVVWCCGSICRQLLTFIQICSGHTVGAVLLKVGLFRKISWCSWWSSNLDAKSTFEMFWFYWHFLHQFIIFSKYLGCRITVCSLRILMLFFLKVHNFFRKAQVCLLFSQSGWRQYSWSMILSELLLISTFLYIHGLQKIIYLIG